MNKYGKATIWVFLMLFTLGCEDFQAPEFQRISVLKVHDVNQEFVTLKGLALFNNPQKQGYKVKNIKLDVIYEGETVANVSNSEVSKISPVSEFEIPFTIQLPVEALKKNLLSNLMAVIRGKTFDFEFHGRLKVAKFGLSKSIPIDHRESVKIKL